MAAGAVLLSLCLGALPPCPSNAGMQCVAELARGPGSPSGIAVSHDDTLVAVTARWTGLHVYKVSTGEAVRVPSYERADTVAFSPDAGKVVVGSMEGGGVAVVSLTTGRELWMDAATGSCSAVAYSPDGTRVASAHRVGDVITIYIRDAATGDLLLSLTAGHTNTILDLTYTPDGGRLISGGYDPTVVVWNATTGAILKTLADHTSTTGTIRVSPDGLYFAIAGFNRGDTLNIYNMSDYSVHKKITNTMYVSGASFNRDWTKVVVVGSSDDDDSAMRVYMVDSGSLLLTYATPANEIHEVSYFHKSDTIVTAQFWSKDAGVHLWQDVETQVPPPPTPAPTAIRGHAACPSDAAGPHCIAEIASGIMYSARIAVSSDDTLVAMGFSREGGLRVYNMSTAAAVSVPAYGDVGAVAVSPGGDKVALSRGGGAAVVSLITGTELSSWKWGCNHLAFSPDGRHVACAYLSYIDIWDPTTGDLVTSLKGGHLYAISSMAYTPDGREIISVSAGRRVVVWNVLRHAPVHTLNDTTIQTLTSVRVSPSGQHFGFIANRRRTVRIYKLSDRTLHRDIPLPMSATEISFSHDGSKLVVVGGAMYVYSVQTGSLLKSYAVPGATHAVSYFHNSDTIVTADGTSSRSYKGRVLLWADVAESTPLASTAPPTPAPATLPPPTPAPPTTASDSPLTPTPALPPCPSHAGPHCIAQIGDGIRGSKVVVSPDDKFVAISAGSVYNMITGAAVAVPSALGAVAFSPTEDRMATSWNGGAVVSLSTGTHLWRDDTGLSESSNAIAYSPDGKFVAFGYTYTVTVRHAETGDLVFILSGPYGVSSLAYTPDGERLISVSGTYVTVWNATTGATLYSLLAGGATTKLSPDGLYYAVYHSWATGIYKVSDGTRHTVMLNPTSTLDVSFSRDGSKLVMVGRGDTMNVYSVQTGSLLKSYTMPSTETAGVAYLHTSDTIMMISNSGILLWADVAGSTPLPSTASPTPAPATLSPSTRVPSTTIAPDTDIPSTSSSPQTAAPATTAPLTPAPPTPGPQSPARVCTEDKNCRVFGDATATCTASKHCACSTNSGAHCEIPAAGSPPVDVQMSVVATFFVSCDHGTLQALLNTLHAAATARGIQAVSARASCGTLSVAVSGVVPRMPVAATVDALVGALGAAALAHPDLTSVTDASQVDPFVQTAQTSGRDVCTQDALSTVETYDGRCLVFACDDGFSLSVDTRDGKDYHTCTVDTGVPPAVSTPAPDAGDDDLRAGPIAAIVVGCVAAVALLAAVLVWRVRRAAGLQEQQQHNNNSAVNSKTEPVHV